MLSHIFLVDRFHHWLVAWCIHVQAVFSFSVCQQLTRYFPRWWILLIFPTGMMHNKCFTFLILELRVYVKHLKASGEQIIKQWKLKGWRMCWCLICLSMIHKKMLKKFNFSVKGSLFFIRQIHCWTVHHLFCVCFHHQEEVIDYIVMSVWLNCPNSQIIITWT